MARGADTLGLEIHYAMQMSCVTQSPLYAVPPYARRIPWKSGTGRKKKTGQRDRSTIQSKYALMPCSPCWSFFVFFSLVPLSRTYMCSIVLPLSQPPPPCSPGSRFPHACLQRQPRVLLASSVFWVGLGVLDDMIYGMTSHISRTNAHGEYLECGVFDTNFRHPSCYYLPPRVHLPPPPPLPPRAAYPWVRRWSPSQ